jgi:hypothetical protein
MTTHEIPRPDWARALSEFSRRHRGWLVSIDAAAHTPLRSVDLEGDTLVIRPRGAPEVRIERPRALRMDDMGLEVERADGLTRVQFRSHAAPEALDGLAPTER